jgi:hypothetical protein
MDPISIIYLLVLAAANSVPKLSWPDESSLGFNAGISPGKSGFSGFYGHGANQLNLGILYSVGSEVFGRTNVHTGVSYNLTLTDWGLYAAAGLNLTYIIEEGEDQFAREQQNQPDPLSPPIEGGAWRSHGIANPEVVIAIGEALWFGHRSQFGIHADAGVALPFGYGVSHTPYPVVGAGLSYRFKLN